MDVGITRIGPDGEQRQDPVVRAAGELSRHDVGDDWGDAPHERCHLPREREPTENTKAALRRLVSA
jgi:hypothetical protein